MKWIVRIIDNKNEHFNEEAKVIANVGFSYKVIYKYGKPDWILSTSFIILEK